MSLRSNTKWVPNPEIGNQKGKKLTTKNFPATRYNSGTPEEVRDTLTVEAGLQIKVNGVPFTTTMRTPGADHELVRGFLFTESIITDPDAPIVYRDVIDPKTEHIVAVKIEIDESFIEKPIEGRRTDLTTSSCGLCGTRELKELQLFGEKLPVDPEKILKSDLLPQMMEQMRQKQGAFNASGGCHGSAAFDYSGKLLTVYEDIGRHNAVDKVIGSLLQQKRLEEVHAITVSGRISYEIIYKAFKAGIPIVAAVSAPSSMAVEIADMFGMTVIGFCRGERATVYSQPERVRP